MDNADRILSFTALDAEASGMMAIVQPAMLGELPYTAAYLAGPKADLVTGASLSIGGGFTA
jgi:hypothetical protein